MNLEPHLQQFGRVLSVEAYVTEVLAIKQNRHLKRTDLIAAAQSAVDRRDQGAVCTCCGQEPIWAAAATVTGEDMCFTCTTGEADPSEDTEIQKGRV